MNICNKSYKTTYQLQGSLAHIHSPLQVYVYFNSCQIVSFALTINRVIT